ncbi:hypothetical protein bpr_II150 (plasmid) [Butyrivibrio proteoclasticus B316]|uniref:Uncharacterized protein n=1 Tax=Butyrivibrio proteoclasticus (strain ATCC 51982 / DSM 14932 / B316) TaxID=515622 RepID=E0S3V6_BUTPB|nr:hypothetical protein [Butyrivibrio proteoclasticus]ADL36088.1 hypothetical protein bpr_II150 [Butyrivibrio proteoclasticus B316]
MNAIEKIENYKKKVIESETKKLKDAYTEAKACYNDTGYDRYYNKMEKIEKELDELEGYASRDQAISDAINEKTKLKAEIDKIKKDLSNKLFYLIADLPDCAEARNLKEYIENNL